ncbi:MAG: hypothetical protein KGL35_00985 [Bradyrhizobium sp.]|nr:hypothetical protein [Bradyrhizobium sp.]
MLEMNRDHEITLTLPEIEVCIDTSSPNDPCAEHCARPDDKIVQAAVQRILEAHEDELIDLCADFYAADCEERRAENRIARMEYEEYR